MTRGVTVSGYSNPNNIEIMMHCKKFFSGSISFLLLKQRLHRKRCDICKKHFSEDLDKQTKEYFINKQKYLSEL